jgi:DNA-binding response OmpR family regulator
MPKAQVLILEEEHDMAEKFNPILIESGYETFQAHSLHEAYQHAKQSRPDVILVGDNFHKHSGLEICEELRGEIDTCYANILLLVPAVDKNIQERAREAGVNDIVQNDIDSQNLLKRIEALLNPV